MKKLFNKKNEAVVNAEGEEIKEEKNMKAVDTKFIVKVVGTVAIGALAIGAAVYKFVNKDSVDAGYSDLPGTDDFSEVTPVADESDFVGE